MYIDTIFVFLLFSYPTKVYLCNYEINELNGTISLPAYENNFECNWIFNLSSVANQIQYRSLLLIFHHFDTEFAHDELFIGETIHDISKYNSKLYRFSGSKLPDPCLIPLRGEILTRSIWMQFISDQSNTGSGFVIDFSFQTNQSISIKPKSLLIDADIRHPVEFKSKNVKQTYPYPSGNISSPNYPQHYSNNIICRWRFYHRNAFIRLSFETFETESHYDTLVLHLGQNLNNRAMILYEWSGTNFDQQNFFIPNDNLYLIFTTDKTINATGFSLQYEIIEKEISTSNIVESQGVIHSKTYPHALQTNLETTWIINMNQSNEIDFQFHDIDFDFDHDYLQIHTDTMIYSITTQKTLQIQSFNQIKILLRTKHSQRDTEFRGFNLTYQTRSINSLSKTNDRKNQSLCGQKYTSSNGTIEFSSEIFLSFDCYFYLEVDDGQNLYLRIDELNWDSQENFLDIGLFHQINQNQLFHISDVVPGSWFIANDSQLWLRFSSSQYSLGISTFRLFYTETIRWSTVLPDAYRQILDDYKLFPYRIISLPTYNLYHNLTQKYIWQIEAFDNEVIHIKFHFFQAISNKHICFSIKTSLKISQICTNDHFPLVHYQIGSCELSIEPELISMLVQYDLQIEKYKKRNKIIEIDFQTNQLNLSIPMIYEPFIQIEWWITIRNDSSGLIFDIENLDRNTQAELILPDNNNTTKIYFLEKMFFSRFSHVLYSISSTILKIIYKSYSLPKNYSQRLFRLNFYRISQSYFHFNQFYYIFFKQNRSINFKWSIHGQYENSIFFANFYSFNSHLVLQTTANINLSMNSSFLRIPSSDFEICLNSKLNSSEFLLILYEDKQDDEFLSKIIRSNRTTDILQTNSFARFLLNISSTSFNTIDFLILQADNTSVIRLYDFYEKNQEYLLLNSAIIQKQSLPSVIGLRFSIRKLAIHIQLQSINKTPIRIRYKTRFDNSTRAYNCVFIDLNSSCVKFHSFDYKSISMNQTRINHLWSYALRGSVTLIIENVTIENFEKFIYRNLRQSLAKIVRKFCWKTPMNCLSNDTDAIRSDHVIIQSYEEQHDANRVYVALFIKDPYRQTIALTNEQFLSAIKYNEAEIYQDIKHHIHIPTVIFSEYSLDSVWLYGVCLLILLILLVIILMLIMILLKKPFRRQQQLRTKASEEPMDQILNTSSSNESESTQTSNSTLITKSPPKFYYQQSTIRPSYFNSTIESAINQRLDDEEEPIPFIDENLSNTHSRKSSACWSERTSLSSRFTSLWKFNKDKRRSQHRTMQYTLPPTQQNDQL